MYSRKIERWDIDSEYFQSEDYKLNNRVALEVSKKGYQEISRKYTLIEPDNIEKVFRISDQVYSAFSGSGIDLGGGVGSVSSVIARSDKVDNITCVEITENCVTKCHPIIIPKILNEKHVKVRSVIGDFNNLNIESGSLDFAVAWDSIHHSNNVVRTLLEANRVLKDRGHLIVVDRAHNNSTDDSEIERMLNIQYSKEFLIENYLPEDKVLTRRDNGEHEYRYQQWDDFFELSGFIVKSSFIVKESSSNNLLNKNDAGINEEFVEFELGGFERKKVIYLLEKCEK